MDYLSLLAFDEYLQLAFLPCLQHFSMAKSRNAFSELFSRAALFEVLEWLRFGVELGVYTQESAQKLLQEYRLSLYEQCSLYPQEVEHLLPPDRIAAVRRMIESTDVEPRLRFEAPSHLSMTFQMLLDLVARLDADQGARSFLTALIYVTDSSWLALENRQITGPEIMAALQGDQQLWVDGNRSYVYAGFFRVVQHLEDTLEILDHKHRLASMQDWVLFRQSFREIHGWRHNDQKNSAVSNRLMNLTRKLASVMEGEFAAEGGSIQAGGLAAYVYDLHEKWGGLALPAVRFAVG